MEEEIVSRDLFFPYGVRTYATIRLYKSSSANAFMSRQKDYKGYIAPVVVIRGYGLALHNGRGCSKRLPQRKLPPRKEELLKAGVTGRRAIFLAGNPLTDARVFQVTRLGRLPAGAYLRNNVSLNREMSECPRSSLHSSGRAAAVVKITRPRFCSWNFEVKVAPGATWHSLMSVGFNFIRRNPPSFLIFRQFSTRDLSRDVRIIMYWSGVSGMKK